MKITYQKGHTLIELLAAVFIISIAIVGAMQLISFNVSNISAIRNNLVASNLVQESMEITRNIRDNDWHAGNNFGTSLPMGTWRVDIQDMSLLPQNDNPPLNKNAIDGTYSHGTGEATLFKRTVEITKISDVHIKVDAKVTWVDRRGNHEVNAQAHLYDWY